MFYLKQLKINTHNLQKVTELIHEKLHQNKSSYICVTNTRTSYLSSMNEQYLQIQNDSFLTVPDGTPLVWIARNKGFKTVERITGLSLLEKVLDISADNKYRHYFYGSTPETQKLIKQRIEKQYPDVNVLGYDSPPFRKIEDFNVEDLALKINNLEIDFFWCGLGAPKQEILCSKLSKNLNSTCCIGIGLAFEHFSGSIRKPPSLVSRLNLEWLYRCFQQPLKARRFIIPFFWMSYYLLKNIYKKNDKI